MLDGFVRYRPRKLQWVVVVLAMVLLADGTYGLAGLFGSVAFAFAVAYLVITAYNRPWRTASED